MKRIIRLCSLFILTVAFSASIAGGAFAVATLSAADYKAGDSVTIEGKIAPGKDLYVAVASQTTFAPKDTKGVHETKRLAKEAKKRGFNDDTRVPALYYMLTTNPEKFGKVADKRFGGPSFIKGIYKTTMFKLAKFDGLDAEAKRMLGSMQTQDQWNFYKFNHESTYGINTITKERTNKGKVVIFSRSVLGDYKTTGKYWDKGTSIELDKTTGKFKASFKTYRHTPPDTKFDVLVNGAKVGTRLQL